MLLLIFEVEFLQVLTWLVHVMESQDLVISHLDLLRELLCEVLFGLKLALEVKYLRMVGLAPFIGLSNLSCPLALFAKQVLLNLKAI